MSQQRADWAAQQVRARAVAGNQGTGAAQM